MGQKLAHSAAQKWEKKRKGDNTGSEKKEEG